MANPILNEKAANEAAAGWAAPDAAAAGQYGAPRSTPITDGPVSTWHPGAFTVGGTVTAAGVLLVLLLGAAAAGWASTSSALADGTNTSFPGLAIGGILVGFVCALVVSFKPMLARFLAPVYALGEGFFLGVISKYYDSVYNGIVVQAVGATLAVFLVMLTLYRTRILKVTDRFRRIVVGATMGLMMFYAVSFVISLFAGSGSISFFNSSSPMGIVFSVLAAGLAAMMLAVDFDLIEKGAQRGWPKGMEWYAAFGLLTTLVWLYLELLRLLSKLQGNRR